MTAQQAKACGKAIWNREDPRCSDVVSAAAHEMLAALKMVTNPAISFATSMSAAHAAIARAEGRGAPIHPTNHESL